MNFDWRCDTRICWSQAELYRNHTNGIQEIQCIYMQACNVHDSCCLIFIATSTAKWQLICVWISKPVSPSSLLHSTMGIAARRWHPPLAKHIEKLVAVSLSAVFMFFSPIPNLFSSQRFQLSFSSVTGVDSPPSVHTGNNSLPSLQLPVRECHKEASNC